MSNLPNSAVHSNNVETDTWTKLTWTHSEKNIVLSTTYEEYKQKAKQSNFYYCYHELG